MHLYASSLHVRFLGFAAIFLCVGIGFSFMKAVNRDMRGPGAWAAAFLLNAIGFFLWAGIVPLSTKGYFLAGEMFHFTGFNVLLAGTYRFAGLPFRRRNVAFFAGVALLWCVPIALFAGHGALAVTLLRTLKSGLFLISGVIVARTDPESGIRGKRLAAASFFLWGAYNMAYGFIPASRFSEFAFGILAGFQVVSAFGLIVMFTDRMRMEGERKDAKIERLERLLPICAHCKRIRDDDDSWQDIEDYVERQTSSRLSHGICPDCLAREFPQYADRVRAGTRRNKG